MAVGDDCDGAPGRLIVEGERGRLELRLLPSEPGEFRLLELRERVSRPVLTAREQEILERAACGAGNKEIARALRISRSTVENHLAAIYRKLGVTNRTAAVARFRR
jgi:DNA-binding NarL/FixJ family response regulator